MADGTRKDEIVKIAKNLLAKRGEAGFSLRAVAKEVGIKLASLQYHFPSRASLVEAMLADTIALYVEDLREATNQVEQDPENILRAALRTLTGVSEFVEEEEIRLEIHLWALALNDPSVDAAIIKYNRVYIDTLSGLITDAVPEIDANEAHRRALAVASLQEGSLLFMKPEISRLPQSELLKEIYQASLLIALR